MINKYKLKLSLIDDYIFVFNLQKTYGLFLECKKFCSYIEILNSAVIICNETLNVYNKIFLRLKLMNHSLLLLNKQVNEQKIDGFAEKYNNSGAFIQHFKQNTQKLKHIIELLPKKLQKLSLNNIEIDYILQKLVLS